ncbi:MAG: hypothetical protein OXG97_05640 [Candidatus Poribacteria bacterium]|nr:hypothetical protein [Candidatus Poribacteria bacterium]
MMKKIHIFGIILLVAVLALPLDAVDTGGTCDGFQATLEACQKAVDVLENELRGREIQKLIIKLTLVKFIGEKQCHSHRGERLSHHIPTLREGVITKQNSPHTSVKLSQVMQMRNTKIR